MYEIKKNGCHCNRASEGISKFDREAKCTERSACHHMSKFGIALSCLAWYQCV